jgi:hypothetical protein
VIEVVTFTGTFYSVSKHGYRRQETAYCYIKSLSSHRCI